MQVEQLNKKFKIASIILTCFVFVLFNVVIITMSMKLYIIELAVVVLDAISLAAYYITENEIKENRCK